MFTLLKDLKSPAKNNVLSSIPEERITPLKPLAKSILEYEEKKSNTQYRNKEKKITLIASLLFLAKVRDSTANWYNDPKSNKDYKLHKALAEDYPDWQSLLSGEISIFRSPAYYQSGTYPNHLLQKFKGDTSARIFEALTIVHELGYSYNDTMIAISALERVGLIELTLKGFTKFSLKQEAKVSLSKCHMVMNNFSLSSEEKFQAEQDYLKLQQKISNFYVRDTVKYSASKYKFCTPDNWKLHYLFPNDEKKFMEAVTLISNIKRIHYNSESKRLDNLAISQGAIVRHKGYDSSQNPVEKNQKNVDYYQLPAPKKYCQPIQKINKKIEQLQKLYPGLPQLLKMKRIFATHKSDIDLSESDTTEYGRLFSQFQNIPKVLRNKLITNYNYSEIDFENFNLNVLFLEETGKKYEGDIYTDLFLEIAGNSKYNAKTDFNSDEIKFYRKNFIKPLLLTAFNSDGILNFRKSVKAQIYYLNLLNTDPRHRRGFDICKFVYANITDKDERYKEIRTRIGNEYSCSWEAKTLFKSSIDFDKLTETIINKYELNFIKRHNEWSTFVRSSGFNPSQIHRINTNIDNIYRAIKKICLPIKNRLFRMSAGHCQRIESEIALKLIKKMQRKKLLPLSIHDAIYVPKHYENYFNELKEKYLNSIIKNQDKFIKKIKLKTFNYLCPIKKRGIEIQEWFKIMSKRIREKDSGLDDPPDPIPI